jgi:cell division control protein 6
MADNQDQSDGADDASRGQDRGGDAGASTDGGRDADGGSASSGDASGDAEDADLPLDGRGAGVNDDSPGVDRSGSRDGGEDGANATPQAVDVTPDTGESAPDDVDTKRRGRGDETESADAFDDAASDGTEAVDEARREGTDGEPDGGTSADGDGAVDDSAVDDSAVDDSAVDDSAVDDVADDTESGPDDVSVGAGGTERTADSPSASVSAADVDLDDMVLEDEDDGNQGLFDDLLSGEPIFENKEVLRPSYTPHELPHRKEQINKMATILVAALRGETPSNILIYGKTGTGKTASAKFVSQELESTSQKYSVPCEVEYINCEVTDTQYRVLAQLANKFIEENEAVIDEQIERLEAVRDRARDDPSILFTGGDVGGATAAAEGGGQSDDPVDPTQFDTVDEIEDRIADLEAEKDDFETVPMTGWPTDRVYSVFFDAVDYHERVVVIMLDEIDKLVEKSGDDTLYNLSRMNSELENSRVSIMGISNDLKFTDFLDPRVKSSLGEEEIVFPPYDANQLQDILQHRADVAFKGESLTDGVIPLCAALAAQEHGDARRALDLLRTAGELAERSQAEVIEQSHVRKAQEKIELDRVVEVVRTLPTQSKLVLFSIILLEKNGVHNINTGEVYNIYTRLCEEIDADDLTQRRVTDLISELDMLGIVNAVVVSKGRYGRTKEISLSVPKEETEAVLVSDSRLSEIEDIQPFVQARFDN